MHYAHTIIQFVSLTKNSKTHTKIDHIIIMIKKKGMGQCFLFFRLESRFLIFLGYTTYHPGGPYGPSRGAPAGGAVVALTGQ